MFSRKVPSHLLAFLPSLRCATLLQNVAEVLPIPDDPQAIHLYYDYNGPSSDGYAIADL
jgi:hypothetical protein